MSNFKYQGIPHTNALAPNTVCNFKGFHISFNRSTRDYGCPTAALVIKNHLFFILRGDHSEDMRQAAIERGLEGCLDYFISHIQDAHESSEHYIVIGEAPDVFDLRNFAQKALGDYGIEKLKASSL